MIRVEIKAWSVYRLREIVKRYLVGREQAGHREVKSRFARKLATELCRHRHLDDDDASAVLARQRNKVGNSLR